MATMNRQTKARSLPWPFPLRAGAIRTILSAACLVTALLAPAPAWAGSYIWDQDDDRIDDRMESVQVGGYRFAFENADSLMRQRIDVSQSPGGLLYGVYVVFQNAPGTADLLALTALGMPVLHRYEFVPAVRSVATFAQIELAASIGGVERIEAVPILYPWARDGAASMGVRDATDHVFPTWALEGGAAGEGQVVAILDTGVNDAPDGSYPGHESLSGRCLGGAVFVNGDSLLDTPRGGSMNPVDRGGAVTRSHGTHVASIIAGTGGSSGYAQGVAPAARFVDVKVLNDAGIGTGVVEAIDWCLHNRLRDWGDPDPALQGIDFINLSLSTLDESDGNDLAARAANRASELGIVVVASIGNDGAAGSVPSPASADGAIAVGAFDTQRTPLSGDDQYAFLNNTGPRASDGDMDSFDELKPDLLAPGVAVLSADGSLTTDGAQYQRLTGTSMAAAFVSGAACALRSDYPDLTPAALAALLRSTALRHLTGLPGQGGPDPRWFSATGFGAVDLYAARLEREQPERSQVRRVALAASSPDEISAIVWTQRERGAAWFAFERAADLGGAPGAFAAVDSVAAAGDSSLADADNLQEYTRVWPVPEGERGGTFWYRVAYTEQSVRHVTPARRFTSPLGASAATIEVTIVHNAYDTDVDAEIIAGAGPSPSFALPATSGAVSSEWVSGASTTGNIAWTFRIEIPEGAADAFLPPTPSAPWRLRVSESGYLNRSGRLTDYRLVWHAPGGDVEYEGSPIPQQTLEGFTIQATIPDEVVAAPDGVRAVRPVYGPNPARAGEAVRFESAAPGDLRVFDLAGREVGSALFAREGSAYVARWDARRADGRPLPSGVYFARAGAASMRLVLIGR